MKKTQGELSWKDKRKCPGVILVTGWTWYIGSHGVIAFEQAWYHTVIVDNWINSSITTLDWIEKIIWYKPDFFAVDIRNKESLKEVFKKYNFDGVLHFAGLKAVWESCQKPLEYFDNNVTGSLVLFELMQEFGVKNIIFSSSATVYKTKEVVSWFTEQDPVWECSNPYGTTKFLLENILKDLAIFSGFQVMNLRYFNPIWAHESWYIWENPNGLPNNLLPYVMKVAQWELSELKVFWDDYDTIDGTWVRDYIDVCDLIDGHLKAYEKITHPNLPLKLMEGIKSWTFEVYNLWTGKWVSVLEIIKTVEKITEKEVKYQICERRPWDLGEVYCNPTKALLELHWKTVTSLEESIKNMWKFYNNK